MHDAATGFGTPFISGKDSLNNEYRSDGERLPVIPTLLISAVSVIDDASQTVDMSLKHPGNLLYQIGITRDELAGSHYLEIAQNLPSANDTTTLQSTDVPRVDIQAARTTMKALGSTIRKGLVHACHDLSEGGLAVAAAEMSLAGLLGMTIDVGLIPLADAAPGGLGYGAVPEDAYSYDELNTILLFSESASRFFVEIAPGNQDTFESFMRANGVQHFARIGTVTETERFVVRNRRQVLIDTP